MAETSLWHFGPFYLDGGAERLWRGPEAVHLTVKAFAVLRHLVEHAGQLVTKDALFAAAWATPYVSDAALAVCIRELRQALGDTAQTPQYVETARGRGYRFIAPVSVPGAAVESAVAIPTPVAVPLQGLLVGRQAEWTVLRQCWTQAQQGARQVVLVTGEAGIGKTTLVDAWVAQVMTSSGLWLGRGQCIEHHGAGEAYLPLLEALGRLGRGPEGAHLVQVLHQQALSWLVHLPALVAPETFESLQRRAGGTPRERMLRELAEAVEVLTAVRPLMLVLEDLHWSDGATLDWLAYVARRRETARLLVLGTYRPVEAIIREHRVHAVTQELRLHGQATEVILGPWPTAEIALYLSQRCGTDVLPEGLAEALHQRTEGNPLFLVAVLDDLVQQGVLRQTSSGWDVVGGLEAARRGVPTSLRQLIERHCAQLAPAEQALLEAASVVGTEFSAAAVAAGVGEVVEAVEQRCATLARRGQFVQPVGTDAWPDGTVAARYGFLHSLYREILYERVPISQQVRWHRQIGTRLEAGYGVQTRAIAAVLAEHFVRGRELPRAILYLAQAGDNARQRSALHEAATHLRLGLELLTTLPESPARLEHELTLLLTLGLTLSMMQGQAAPEVGRVYDRARVLCQQLDDTSRLFQVLMGLRRFYSGRGALQIAQAIAEQLDELAQRSHDPEHRMEAHLALGLVSFCRGDLGSCRAHTGRGLALEMPAQHPTALAVAYGNRRASCLNYAALAMWALGYPAQALQQSQEAVRLAQQRPVPANLAFTLHFASCLRQLRREAQETAHLAAATMTLATEDELAHWLGQSTILYGWAVAAQGQHEVGLQHLHRGLTAMDSTGSELLRPYYLALLAEVYGQHGQATVGQTVLAEAWTFVDSHDEHWYDAELYRLQGALLLLQAPPAVHQAEQCFQQALHTAQTQQARTFALRAAVSLARLWHQQGQRAAAQHLLAEVYNWFSEGFDTADLQEAGALLKTLA
jgi:DNA-binding winged helix-turn-helix (wHTH) protein/predicted ATPase